MSSGVGCSMEPWGFEPQIQPCHGRVIPFHYGPGRYRSRKTLSLRISVSRSSASWAAGRGLAGGGEGGGVGIDGELRRELNGDEREVVGHLAAGAEALDRVQDRIEQGLGFGEAAVERLLHALGAEAVAAGGLHVGDAVG